MLRNLLFAVSSSFYTIFRGGGHPRLRSTFLPLVAESRGGWGEVAVAVVDRMARSLARQTGQREEEVMRQTWSRLQRSNGQQKTLTQVYVVIFVFTDSLH